MKRDKISKEQAQQRINAQLDEEYYINHSDFIIKNNGEDIKNQVDKIINEIL